MKKLLLATIMTISLVGCSGGGSSSGGGNYGYTHSEVAGYFTDDLWVEAGYDLELYKVYTEQYDFVVVYDHDLQGYYAIDVGTYDPDYDSAYTYYNMTTVEPVSYVGNNQYMDAYGYIYEKTTATPKDLAKMAGIKEAVELDKRAEFLSSELALSMDRSKEIARLSQHWKKASLKGMTDSEHDTFSTELLGFSISKAKETIKSEGQAGIDSLIETAASANGITPEHASKLMTKLFGL